MASDPSFHTPVHDLTVAAVVRASGLDASPDLRLDRPIACFAPAETPVHGSMVFVEHRAAITDRLAICAAVLCKPHLKDAVAEGPAVLAATNPRHAYQDAVLALYPHSLGDDIAFADPSSARQVDGAWVSASANLEADVTIQPGAVIGDDVHIGAGTTIGAATTIARNCRIGRNARIGPNVSIQYALIGDRVSILAGARIGQEGFGFVPRTDGLRRMPQIGRAIVQEDVEIGANTAVDRGALGDTVIGQGTKIDNLVQIAHNVVIGTNCVIAGNCGISGSVTIGHGCRLGGGVGIADHLTIGDGVSIMAQAGVASSIPDGQTWAGAPAMPVREQAKQILTLRRLADGPNKSPRNG